MKKIILTTLILASYQVNASQATVTSTPCTTCQSITNTEIKQRAESAAMYEQTAKKLIDTIENNDTSTVQSFLQTYTPNENQKCEIFKKILHRTNKFKGLVAGEIKITTIQQLITLGLHPTTVAHISYLLFKPKYSYAFFNGHAGLYTATKHYVGNTVRLWTELIHHEKLVTPENITAIIKHILQDYPNQQKSMAIVLELLKTKSAQDNKKLNEFLLTMNPRNARNKVHFLLATINKPEQFNLLLSNEYFTISQKELDFLVDKACNGGFFQTDFPQNIEVDANSISLEILLTKYNSTADYIHYLENVLPEKADEFALQLTDKATQQVTPAQVLLHRASPEYVCMAVSALLNKNVLNSTKTQTIISLLPAQPTSWILANAKGLGEQTDSEIFFERMKQYKKDAVAIRNELVLYTDKDISEIVLSFLDLNHKLIDTAPEPEHKKSKPNWKTRFVSFFDRKHTQ